MPKYVSIAKEIVDELIEDMTAIEDASSKEVSSLEEVNELMEQICVTSGRWAMLMSKFNRGADNAAKSKRPNGN